MARKTTTTKSKRRAKVKELSTEQELTPDHAKSVQGGRGHSGGVNVMADGSVRFIIGAPVSQDFIRIDTTPIRDIK